MPTTRTLDSYQGEPAASGIGKDPVNEPMIRHWCEAMGDANPVYTDPERAARTHFGGIVAPPAMLQAWLMAGLSGRTARAGAYDELLGRLDAEGCAAVVATDCEQTYARPLRPGDRVAYREVVESVSARKETALGAGHFVTTRTDVEVDGRLAGTHRFRILKYRPAGRGRAAAGRPDARRPRPVVNRDNQGFWDGVAAHRLLVQRCRACQAPRFPWLPGCNDCGSGDWEPFAVSGRGTVYSHIVVHHPAPPGIPPPCVVALVELAEGVRVLSNVVDVPPEEVVVGMPVELEFRRVDEELTLPLFRPSGAPRPRPPEPPPPPPPPAAPPTPATVAPGLALPVLRVPVTRTLIVAGAIASRDYQDVHHDPELARAKGAPDIFMNILTTNGLVGRFVTDWAGPDAELLGIAIRLGAPNHPGDEMVLTGRVTAVDGARAEVAVTGANRLGDHVTGTVRLRLGER
ncbi:hypothetical protein GCM10027168_00490 [Streptomyces capparidis]